MFSFRTDRRWHRFAGILYAVLYGSKLIEDAEGVTGLIPAIHEGTLGMIAQGGPAVPGTRRGPRERGAEEGNVTVAAFDVVARLASPWPGTFAEAQASDRRATNLTALLAYPGFYHGRPIVIVGKVALDPNGQLKVSDDDASDPSRVQGQRPGRAR